MLHKKFTTHGAQNGFSLIEVLVSLALFAIVMTMAVGTLVVLIDANAKAQSIETLVNNVASTVDAMTRDLRTGYNYYCNRENISNFGTILDDNLYPPRNCDQEGFIAFTETGSGITNGKGSSRIAYRLRSERIERHLGDDSASNEWQPVTPEDVRITDFEITVAGAESLSDGDERSPTVTIFIAGEAGDVPLLDTSFNLQTTVTQQLLDL